MALARAGGQRVVIVSLTAGELGTEDPDLRGRVLASRRREAIGLWQGDVPCTPEHELALALRGAPEVLDRKVAALRAHDSQTSGLIDLIGMDDSCNWWSVETFAEAT